MCLHLLLDMNRSEDSKACEMDAKTPIVGALLFAVHCSTLPIATLPKMKRPADGHSRGGDEIWKTTEVAHTEVSFSYAFGC